MIWNSEHLEIILLAINHADSLDVVWHTESEQDTVKLGLRRFIIRQPIQIKFVGCQATTVIWKMLTLHGPETTSTLRWLKSGSFYLLFAP